MTSPTPAADSQSEDSVEKIIRQIHFEEQWGSLSRKELFEDTPDQCQKVIDKARAALDEYYLGLLPKKKKNNFELNTQAWAYAEGARDAIDQATQAFNRQKGE